MLSRVWSNFSSLHPILRLILAIITIFLVFLVLFLTIARPIIGKLLFEEIGQTPPLSKVIFQINFKQGAKNLTVMRKIARLDNKSNLVEQTQREFFENWFSSKNAYYFLEPGKLTKLDKSTRKNSKVNLPQEIASFSGKPRWASFDIINDRFAIFKVFDINGGQGLRVRPYLFNSLNDTFVFLKDYYGTCKFLYCEGLRFLAFISEDEILVEQSGGDACWGEGILTKLNLKTYEKSTLTQIATGCTDGSDQYGAYLGYYKSSVFVAPNSDTNGTWKTTYRRIDKIDATSGQRTTIISNEEVFKNIENIFLDEKNGRLYFSYAGGNTKSYDLASEKFIETSSYLPRPKTTEEKFLEFINENKDFFEVTTLEKRVNLMKLQTSPSDYFYDIIGVDSDGDVIEALQTNKWRELRKIVPGTYDNCGFSNNPQPVIVDKKGVMFRFHCVHEIPSWIAKEFPQTLLEKGLNIEESGIYDYTTGKIFKVLSFPEFIKKLKLLIHP